MHCTELRVAWIFSQVPASISVFISYHWTTTRVIRTGGQCRVYTDTMGLKRMILWAILGPILIYLALLCHTVYHVVLTKPGPIQITDFPRDLAKTDKEAIIKSRKPMLEDVMDGFAGKLGGKRALAYVQSRFTEDAEFEDPLQKWKSHEELLVLVNVMHSLVHDVEYDIHADFHGPHENILDWTMTLRFKVWPSLQIPLSMRTHILVEPAAKPGDPEKIFKIYEEWNGNVHLNEKTIFSPLGKVHAQMRRFFGQASAAFLGLLV